MLENKQDKTILDYALEYHKLGFCMIPIPYGKKKGDEETPQIRWKKYMKQRPDEQQLQEWFSSNHSNIAVVCGEVSGGLACRDFDDAEGIKAYESWAKAKPELAKKLPTAQTPHGYHVYFHYKGQAKTNKTIDTGELRVSKCYCVLPPSRVIDDKKESPTYNQILSYEWIIKPNGNIPELSPKDTDCLCLSQSASTQRYQRTQEILGDNKSGRERGNVLQIALCAKIQQAIDRTLPFRSENPRDKRHRKIFDFARELRSMPGFWDADPHAFRLVVNEWYNKAKPYLEATREENWSEFVRSWPKVNYKIGESPLDKIFEKSIQVEPPKIAVELYPENKKLQFLASLCRELQRSEGDNPFWIGNRTAERLLKIHWTTANNYLFLLNDDGIIEEITKGSFKTQKTSEYRYIADMND